MNFKQYLYQKTKSTISKWDEEGIYAISFFVYSNELIKYQQYENISMFAISYNTEEDCGHASSHNEARWNYAFWRQNVTPIIDPYDENNEGTKLLFEWYEENGIDNIGFEDSYGDYDENGRCIAKGPIGYYELLTLVSEVARQLQIEGFVAEKFGKIPIIVHDLEYPWYAEEATANANPNGEANTFLEALRNCFM